MTKIHSTHKRYRDPIGLLRYYVTVSIIEREVGMWQEHGNTVLSRIMLYV